MACPERRKSSFAFAASVNSVAASRPYARPLSFFCRAQRGVEHALAARPSAKPGDAGVPLWMASTKWAVDLFPGFIRPQQEPAWAGICREASRSRR